MTSMHNLSKHKTRNTSTIHSAYGEWNNSSKIPQTRIECTKDFTVTVKTLSYKVIRCPKFETKVEYVLYTYIMVRLYYRISRHGLFCKRKSFIQSKSWEMYSYPNILFRFSNSPISFLYEVVFTKTHLTRILTTV